MRLAPIAPPQRCSCRAQQLWISHRSPAHYPGEWATLGGAITHTATVAPLFEPKHTASLAGKRSRAFRYHRYLRITKRSGLKITGELTLKRLPKRVTLNRVNVLYRVSAKFSGSRTTYSTQIAVTD